MIHMWNAGVLIKDHYPRSKSSHVLHNSLWTTVVGHDWSLKRWHATELLDSILYSEFAAFQGSSAFFAASFISIPGPNVSALHAEHAKLFRVISSQREKPHLLQTKTESFFFPSSLLSMKQVRVLLITHFFQVPILDWPASQVSDATQSNNRVWTWSNIPLLDYLTESRSSRFLSRVKARVYTAKSKCDEMVYNSATRIANSCWRHWVNWWCGFYYPRAVKW